MYTWQWPWRYFFVLLSQQMDQPFTFEIQFYLRIFTLLSVLFKSIQLKQRNIDNLCEFRLGINREEGFCGLGMFLRTSERQTSRICMLCRYSRPPNFNVLQEFPKNSNFYMTDFIKSNKSVTNLAKLKPLT